ncbi:hypothetical protein GCM10010266_56040 [Streptomyces griseomycini]|nr:hypothetical protein GCM10010266_56040 [Streptomyces griseomycini]
MPTPLPRPFPAVDERPRGVVERVGGVRVGTELLLGLPVLDDAVRPRGGGPRAARSGGRAADRRVGATAAEHDEGHLCRLRLVRVLFQVGRVPVATARDVLGHVDDDSPGRTVRPGAAPWALPQAPEPGEDDPSAVAARAEADRLPGSPGRETAREPAPLSPVHRSRVAAATPRRPGCRCDAELTASYGELMRQVAQTARLHGDLRLGDGAGGAGGASAVLREPVLRALHRPAREEESARRYGAGRMPKGASAVTEAPFGLVPPTGFEPALPP